MREWRWVWGCCPGIRSVRLAALEALAASKQLSLAHLWHWPFIGGLIGIVPVAATPDLR